jgi:undecaprenyl-diphosphatase
MLLAILLFFFVFILIVTHSTIIGSNNLVYHLLRGLRTPTLDKIMVVITSFGYYQMLIPVILVIFLYLILQRRWLPAVHWVVGAVLVSGSILFCKIIYFSPRPPGLLHSPITSSFPSGHTAMAIVIYGLLAFFIARNLMRGWRKFVYWVAAVVCGLIAFSRLYLGVHWLTDVLGGICLGVAILSFVVISYRRYKPVILSSLGLFIVAVVTIAISNGYFLHENYAKRLHDLQRYWSTRTVAIQAWWQGDVSPPIILYRTDRFGRPTKMLNLQWAGPLAKIRATLKLHGWQDFHVDSYAAAMKQLLAQTDLAKHRPLLAKLYEDQPPVLEMIKYSTENGSPLIIRLWQSHILLSPGNIPLWIGAVDYDVLSKHFLFFYHKTSLISATHKASQLFATLHNYTWQIKTLKSAEIPTNLRKQHTIFSVLMVKPR